MQWEAPSFTRIPTGTELGYTNELDREPGRPAPSKEPRRAQPAPARR